MIKSKKNFILKGKSTSDNRGKQDNFYINKVRPPILNIKKKKYAFMKRHKVATRDAEWKKLLSNLTTV